MSPVRLDGKLASADSRTINFDSYRVEVHFTQKIKTETNAMESALLFVGTVVRADGSFTVEIPPRDQLENSLELHVFSPDGELLEIVKRVVVSFKEGEIIKINIRPKEFPTIIENPDPYLGCKIILRGHVITEDGKGVPGRAVALWARPNDATARIIITSTTDKNGHFSGDYSSNVFEEAYGVVDTGGDGKERIPIHLENGKLPQKVILVLKSLKDLRDGTECENETPRTPDTEDIINSPGTYTTDLGGGRCVDFTAPNRTFEEFTFSLVVRTTEPTIKGLTLDEPNTWANRSTFHVVGDLLDIKSSTNKANPDATTERAANERVQLKEIIKNINPQTMKALLREPENLTPSTLVDGAVNDISDFISRDLGRLRTSNPSRGELTTKNPIDWDDEPTFYQATSIAIGHLIQYKQKWKADGYSMGNLLYSVPLGPCQKKQIAIVDWERREIGRRAETMEETERLTALMGRDRAITDIVNGALTEGIHAKSEAGTWGVSGGTSVFGALSFGLWSLGGGSSVAGGTSGSDSEAWQDSARKLSTLALNTLVDNTSQSASAFRSQHGTVVQTVEQQERVTAVTDVISNNNHCHAITIEYFEILRHFLISHECANVQECLFIPLLMSRFDFNKVLRWKSVLRAFLRDRSLDRAFEAIDRIYHNWDGSDLPEGRYSNDDVIDLRGELRLYMYIQRPRDRWNPTITHFDPAEEEWSSLVNAGLLDGFISDGQGRNNLGTRIWYDRLHDNRAPDQDAKNNVFQNEIAPFIATRFVDTQLEFYIRRAQTGELIGRRIDATLTTTYSPNAELFIRLRSEGGPVNIRREDINEFVIRVKGPPSALPVGSRIIIASSSMNYRSAHMEHSLYNEAGVNDDLISSNETSFSTPTDHEERRDPRGEDRETARRLISNLNENLEYYHKVIWLNMDKDRRFMLLDGFTAPNANGKSVASVVENRLIGIVGNSLVLPVAPGFHLDPTYRIEKINDLRHAYAASIPPLSIAIPTRGVYAESIIGKCNSCESKDDTKFWRFEESPCGGEPTAILPVSTETRRAEPGDLRPQQFPTPLVNLQNIPPAPETTGLEAALRLLSTPNIFQNLTGLDQTQKNALAALLSSADLAKFLAKEAASLVRQNSLTGNIDQAMQKIDDTEKAEGISSEEATKLRTGALRGMTGQDSESEAGIINKPEIRKILDQAREFETFEASLSSPGEFASFKTSSPRSSQKGTSSGLNRERIRRARAAIPTGEGGVEVEGDQVRGRILFSNFDINSPELKTEFYQPLNTIAELINSSDDSKLYLEGHASQTGPENFNQILSENRADEIYSHLVNVLGIKKEKVIDVIGLGSADPILDRRGIEEQLNRSVLLVYSVPEPIVRPENIKTEPPQPKPQGYDKWGITQFTSVEVAGIVAGTAATFQLKNMETGEIRNAWFIGYGIGAALKRQFEKGEFDFGGSFSDPDKFTPFMTDNRVVFEDFDGTLARYGTVGASLFIGYSKAIISFPTMGSKSAPEGPLDIDIGGISFGSVGIGGVYTPGFFFLAK